MRDRIAGAIIGGKAQGKSTLTVEHILPAYDLKKDRVLILTLTDPPAYAKFKRVKHNKDKTGSEDTAKTIFTDNPLEALKKWKCGVVKYYNFQDAKQMVKEVHDLCVGGYLRRGAVVFEDCTNYIDPLPAESIRNFLVNHRMFDLDLFFTTHALRFLPKFCRGMVSNVTVFKTNEAYEKASELRTYQYPNHHALFKGWKECMDAPRKPGRIQHHVTIETGV